MRGVGYSARALLLLGASTILSGTAFAGTEAAGATAAAPAETAAVPETTGSDEIIVTARRAAETAQSVPMAITAFSQDTLRRQNISSANELDKAVPGLTVASSQGSPSIPAFAIRGRGLNFGAAAGAVETYFADVPLSMPQIAFPLPPQFFDIGSFQVLKGPQGTLFGRSTTGGAVVIVPHAVDNTFGGYARAQVGNYKNVQLEGALNVPFANDLGGFRVAGTYWKRQGYGRVYPGNVDRLTGTPLDGERFNNIDQYELRATLKLTPTNWLENTTILTYHNDDNRGSAGAGIYRPGALGTAYLPERGYGTLWTDSDVRFRGVQQRNTAFAAINTTTAKVGEEFTLKNVFGLIRTNGANNFPNNSDGNQLQTISQPGTPRVDLTHQYTDEMQIQGNHFDGKFHWIAGYLFDWTRQPQSLTKLPMTSVTYLAPSVACPTPTCVTTNTRYGSNNIDSTGAFISGSYEIVPKLTASAGFRHSTDNVRLLAGNVVVSTLVTPTTVAPTPPPTSTTRLAGKFKGNTYNADLSYKIDNNKLIYGGYRHGYKRGGFQSSGLTSFGPEQVDNFYIGTKLSWSIAGHRVRTNIELFRDNYKGQQLSYTTLNAIGSLVSITDNVDRSRYQGVELDVSADATDWWTISGNYAYISAKITKWTDRTVANSNVDLTRNPIPYVPKNKFSLINRFHFDTSFSEVAVQSVINYQDKFYTGPLCVVYPQGAQNAVGGFDFNALAVGGCTVPKRTTYDARLELNNIRGTRLSLAVNAINLGNKIYWTGTSNTTRTGVEGFAYAPPRMVTVEASYKF